MYKINQIGVESAGVLSELWIETFQQAYSDVHTSENIKAYCAMNFSMQFAFAELDDNKTVCKIASTRDGAVGFYLLKLKECPCKLAGGSIELKQIYILAEHYGTGLGASLYENALNEIRGRDCKWVWLSVSDINYRAKAFYNKLEFQPKSSGPIYEVGTDRLSSTIMVREV